MEERYIYSGSLSVNVGVSTGGGGRLQEYSGARREGGWGWKDVVMLGKEVSVIMDQCNNIQVPPNFLFLGGDLVSHLLEKRLWVHARSGVP